MSEDSRYHAGYLRALADVHAKLDEAREEVTFDAEEAALETSRARLAMISRMRAIVEAIAETPCEIVVTEHAALLVVRGAS